MGSDRSSLHRVLRVQGIPFDAGQGEDMGDKRTRMIGVWMIALIVLLSSPGWSQIAKEQTFSFTGVIEKVDDRLQFVVVNEAKIFISSDTVMVDDTGRVLQAGDLKRRASVALEVIRKPEGFFAKKIVVKIQRRF
jgi:hypothetical protein